MNAGTIQTPLPAGRAEVLERGGQSPRARLRLVAGGGDGRFTDEERERLGKLGEYFRRTYGEPPK